MLEENYDKGHAEHRVAYEALQGSIHHDECEEFDDDKAQEETKKKGKQDSPKPPLGCTSHHLPPLHLRRIRAIGHNRSLRFCPRLLHYRPHVLIHSSGRSSTVQCSPQGPQKSTALAEYSCVDND
ncbi:hypothetical protein Tco_0909619 [Tanacetum coccineum]|uniref:Uncharacterized protein n=1 Tax=Tanacetum coccineum TaxID=301880 RepID=A0ABQ5CRJ0_9ASTR